MSLRVINNYMVIYKTTNKVNNKIYVGKHNRLRTGYLGSGLLLKNAIKKYGSKNFEQEILEYCTKETVNEREIYWIEKLQSQNLNIGYNISSGGDGGNIAPWTEERKQKIKSSKIGKQKGKDNPNYGHYWSKAQKDNLSQKKKGNIPWNKGLTALDPRVKKNADKRLKTMNEKDIWKRGQNHHWSGKKRNGPLNGKWKNVDTEDLVNDFGTGLNLTELSKRFNISRDTVRKRLKENGQ